MNKLITTALAALVLFSFGTAFAQVAPPIPPITASHDVTINIPDVAFLRFTATDAEDDRTAVTPDAVAFTLTVADVSGAAAIAPSNATTANWQDLKVFANYGSGWQVTATVEDTSTGTAGAFVWNKVGVDTWNVDGGTVATGISTGWSSLGFGAADFRLTLNGTELADDYSATVTYTLAIP